MPSFETFRAGGKPRFAAFALHTVSHEVDEGEEVFR